MSAPDGTFVAFEGGDGAGKSTLLSLASARQHPTRGTVEILDETLGRVDVFELRPRIGLSSAQLAQQVPEEEKVQDAVVTASYGVTGRWREEYDIEDEGRALGLDTEQPGAAAEDALEVGLLVVVEVPGEAEAVAQRRREQPGPGGRPDDGEGRQLERDRGGAGALAHHDVHPEVLHGHVEHLLGRAGHPVDLVEEEHLALGERGQDGREVARVLDRGAGGQPQGGVHLRGHDHRQRGLAEPGRTGEQDVVRGAVAQPGGGEHEVQLLAHAHLAHELVQVLGAQRGLEPTLLRVDGRRGQRRGLRAHRPPRTEPAMPTSRRVARSSAATSRPSSSSGRAATVASR